MDTVSGIAVYTAHLVVGTGTCEMAFLIFGILPVRTQCKDNGNVFPGNTGSIQFIQHGGKNIVAGQGREMSLVIMATFCPGLTS